MLTAPISKPVSPEQKGMHRERFPSRWPVGKRVWSYGIPIIYKLKGQLGFCERSHEDGQLGIWDALTV
jgi:hypothetical protein